MKRVTARKGFVLPVALGVILVVAVVVGSVVGYVSYGARAARLALARNRCRFAAQSAIEVVKTQVQARFSAYVGASGTAVKIDPKQSLEFNWFDNVSADGRTIGLSKGRISPLTLQDPPNGINGCTVTVAIGKKVEHETNSSYAAVPIVATAEYTYPDGLTASATIQESVCFATGQSQVFNYAYFVNNYGWMNGSSITINGDMRANANVSLSGSTVNGFVYAAVNDEVGAEGSIKLSGSPRILSASAYRANSQTTTERARIDTGSYDTAGAYDAPANSGTMQLPTYDADGNITGGTVAANSGKPIANEQSDPIPMPFVSDLDDYVEYAKELGGTLKYPGFSYTASTTTGSGWYGQTVTDTISVAGGTVNAHYDGAGPSGDVTQADKGSLVLIGTRSNPIEINGPVVVDGDVIIKGYVKGQGTIYAGRNVHIIGSIQYANEPTWSHTEGMSDEAAESVEESNASKDMLGLVAKGNIVVGDSSSQSWLNTVSPYIKGKRSSSASVVNSYECDPSDADIGYPSTFGGDYTAREYVAGNGYDGSGYFGKVSSTVSQTTTRDWYGNRYTTKSTAFSTGVGRRYYQTACDDDIISSNAGTVNRIDAVLYNNHGIFGTPAAGTGRFNLNGSLVCRDEALIFSGNGLNFNWDMRLMPKANNKVTKGLGLPVGPQEPYTVSWMEVTKDLNPALIAQSRKEDKE